MKKKYLLKNKKMESVKNNKEILIIKGMKDTF